MSPTEQTPDAPTRGVLRFLLSSPALLLCLAIGLFGCLTIYSATFHTAQSYRFVARQAVWLGIGLAVMALCTRIPLQRLERWVLPLSGAALTMLYLVLLFGIRHHGMRGWFRLPLPGDRIFDCILLQPSELAKPIFVLFLARLADWRDPQEEFSWRSFAAIGGACGPWFLALALQPDFGTLLIYLLTFAVIYWLQGGRLQHLAALAGPALAAAMMLSRRYPYLAARLQGFLAPEQAPETAGWHVLQFKATLARGGWFGQSMADAMWSRHYLPLGHSDSVFATVAETFGLAAALVLLAGIGAWVGFGVRQACGRESRFRSLVIAGLTLMLTIQALVHISVTVHLLPATGVTLPLISYGGSSLLSTLAAAGLLLAALRSPDGAADLPSAPPGPEAAETEAGFL